jgi:hypothetical protein
MRNVAMMSCTPANNDMFVKVGNFRDPVARTKLFNDIRVVSRMSLSSARLSRAATVTAAKRKFRNDLAKNRPRRMVNIGMTRAATKPTIGSSAGGA